MSATATSKLSATNPRSPAVKIDLGVIVYLPFPCWLRAIAASVTVLAGSRARPICRQWQCRERTALGDGKFYKSSTQAISAATEATIAFNATDYNSLTRGTFSTVTGVYTAGSAGARILITANIFVAAVTSGDDVTLKIRNGTTDHARTVHEATGGNEDMGMTISAVVSLGAAGTADIRILTPAAETVSAGLSYTNVSIVELA